jgi:hypothetical protein
VGHDWKFAGQRRLSRKEQKTIGSRLEDALAYVDSYVTIPVFGEHANTAELMGGRLTDDLLDIYVEVEVGLDLLRRGGSEGEAAWLWRFGLWSQWGEHAVDAFA